MSQPPVRSLNQKYKFLYLVDIDLNGAIVPDRKIIDSLHIISTEISEFIDTRYNNILAYFPSIPCVVADPVIFRYR